MIKKIILSILICCIPFLVGSSSVADPFCVSHTWKNPNQYSDYDLFSLSLGHRESLNNYKCVNYWGYLGKYQFSIKTLELLGYSGSAEHFLQDSIAQEIYFRKLLVSNKKVLRHYIKKFDNKKINGIVVSESGILAAAHLVGPKSVKLYFKKGLIRRDALGTPLTEYMHLFRNYQLCLE